MTPGKHSFQGVRRPRSEDCFGIPDKNLESMDVPVSSNGRRP